METGLAEELGVGVGDEIVWDVQGIQLPTRVTSLREVDWARFEPNFFVVFQPGSLEDAPQTLVTLTRVESPAARGTLQRRLAERAPERHHARPVRGAGGARAAGGSRRARDPLHGRVHPGHRHAGAGRRAGHEPVPADPRGRAAADPRRHPGAALPHRGGGIRCPRHDGRDGRGAALGRGGVGARPLGLRGRLLAAAAVRWPRWCSVWWG